MQLNYETTINRLSDIFTENKEYLKETFNCKTASEACKVSSKFSELIDIFVLDECNGHTLTGFQVNLALIKFQQLVNL